MRRFELNKHLRNGRADIDDNHPYCRIDLSTPAIDKSLTIRGISNLFVECGPNPFSLYLLLNKGACVKLQIIAPNKPTDWMLNVALDEGATLQATMVDFASFGGVVTINGELFGQGSRLDWHLASLTRNDDVKKYIVNFSHKAKDTTAHMRNFGVIEDKGHLTFTGKSHILQGAIRSSTHQTARIMVFDANSVGKANPFLAIDDNDVSASHAATVGKINEEHMFYLKTRGLNDDEARRLITYGYLAPSIKEFSDRKIRDRLTTQLQVRL